MGKLDENVKWTMTTTFRASPTSVIEVMACNAWEALMKAQAAYKLIDMDPYERAHGLLKRELLPEHERKDLRTPEEAKRVARIAYERGLATRLIAIEVGYNPRTILRWTEGM